MKTRTLPLLLVFLLLFPLLSGCQENNSQADTPRESQVLETRSISFEEAVESIATEERPSKVIEVQMKDEEDAILEDYAKKLYLADNKDKNNQDEEKAIEEIKNNLDPREIIDYISVTKHFTYEENPAYEATLSAVVRLVKDLDENFIIDDVLSITSQSKADPEAYKWEQIDANFDVALDKQSVYLYVKGMFETEVSAGSSSPSLQGFTVSTQDDQKKIYLSKTVKGEEKYTLDITP